MRTPKPEKTKINIMITADVLEKIKEIRGAETISAWMENAARVRLGIPGAFAEMLWKDSQYKAQYVHNETEYRISMADALTDATGTILCPASILEGLTLADARKRVINAPPGEQKIPAPVAAWYCKNVKK